VTFLFTDVEGSTRLWEARPAEAQSAIALHDALLRGAVVAMDSHPFARRVREIAESVPGTGVRLRAPDAYAETHGLCGYDAVHLAAADRTHDAGLVVVAGDGALLHAASTEGMTIANLA